MEHIGKDARPGRTGPSDWFSGEVTMVSLVEAGAPAALRAAMVHFAPGARTHWHTHPLGQMIHIVAGRGRAQRDGGPVITLEPGDTVWFPPGERHWHGAAPESAMSHLAVQEAQNGVSVTWQEPVVD
jgi:quercetin dioxygenase-like cupin family protein